MGHVKIASRQIGGGCCYVPPSVSLSGDHCTVLFKIKADAEVQFKNAMHLMDLQRRNRIKTLAGSARAARWHRRLHVPERVGWS